MSFRRFQPIAFLLALLLPATAVAQDDDRARDEARQHFERGVALMQNENWDGAFERIDKLARMLHALRTKVEQATS